MDPSYVLALRSPLSVARSRAKLDSRRGQQEKSDLEWLVNVVPHFRRMAASPTVIVDFDLLMADPETQLGRVARRLELPTGARVTAAVKGYAASFLKQDMRHTQFDDRALEGDERLNPLTRDAYRWLRRLATDELELGSLRFWQGWSRIEAGVRDLGPVLAHLDRLEAELGVAGWSPNALLKRLLTRLPRPARR
jgi:hypothetical protein